MKLVMHMRRMSKIKVVYSLTVSTQTAQFESSGLNHYSIIIIKVELMN